MVDLGIGTNINTSVCRSADGTGTAGGSYILCDVDVFLIPVQPLAAVTVTVYVPGALILAVALS